jgi:hypothetical protein
MYGCCRLADLRLSSSLAAAIGCSYTSQSLFYLPGRFQRPSNPRAFGPIHKKNHALSAEKRDRLSLQPLEDSLHFQRWARLQNALVICLDAHSSRMMAVSVDTSIVTGSQPFLAGAVVARTDLVWLNSQNDCRSNGSGLHRCRSNPSGRDRLSLLWMWSRTGSNLS